jgi:hypothetical protein
VVEVVLRIVLAPRDFRGVFAPDVFLAVCLLRAIVKNEMIYGGLFRSNFRNYKKKRVNSFKKELGK